MKLKIKFTSVRCDVDSSVSLLFFFNLRWKMCECGDECAEDTKTREHRDVL